MASCLIVYNDVVKSEFVIGSFPVCDGLGSPVGVE